MLFYCKRKQNEKILAIFLEHMISLEIYFRYVIETEAIFSKNVKNFS